MVRDGKKRSKKAGLPPGSLVHIGEQRVKEAKITIIDYDAAHFQEKEAASVEECYAYKGKPTVAWINVEGVHDIEVLEKLGECFGIHPLTLEDIVSTDQRPKMEDHDTYVYIVLKMLYLRDGRVITEQISLVLGENFLISFQEGIKGDLFNAIRERLRSENTRIRRSGADYLAYSLIDSIVDSYFGIMEALGERIEVLEEGLVTHPDRETLRDIHYLKREMIFMRRSVWPLREVVSGLERRESPLIKELTVIYLRDVYDHTIQVIETMETYRDMLSGMIDIYLSGVSNRLNEVVKVLTIISTIFIPLTFITGVYGMNFLYMPELRHPHGYFAVWMVMIAVALVMLLYFRGRKWL